MSGRKKKIYLKIEDKIQIVKELQKGETVAVLSKKYFVSKSKIYAMKRNKKAILKKFDVQSEGLEACSDAVFHEDENKKKTPDQKASETWKCFPGLKLDQMEDALALLGAPSEGDQMLCSPPFDPEALFERGVFPLKEENLPDETIQLVSDPPPLTDEHLDSQDKATLILSNDPLTRMDDLLTLAQSSDHIMCPSYDKFQETLSNFETDTYTKYIITKTKGAFAEEEVPLVHRRVRWFEEGPLSGVPHIVVATRYFSCRYGAPTHSKMLEKYAQKREEQHKLGLCKRYKKVHGSKKLGCPVKFVANRIIIFPELKIPKDTSRCREERTAVKKSLSANFHRFAFESRFACVLPDADAHRFHYRGPSSASSEPMDGRVLQRIKMLVSVGKTDPDDIAEFMEDFATGELHARDKDRRRFFPSRIDIMHTVNRAKLKIRVDPKDQEAIKAMRASWGGDDEVFLRPMSFGKDSEEQQQQQLGGEDAESSSSSSSSSRFLFVYQNEEMKRLFRLYGRNAVFVDAVHRTCEYAWPVYFVTVNTNLSYQVVAFFVTQLDSKATIAEALEMIKARNPGTTPRYGIVSRPWDEIRALEGVYPDAKTFVSSHHRNEAWEKKIVRRENDGLNRAEILSRLRGVAKAATERELRDALRHLKESEAYKASSVKHYYESAWHFQIKRWVGAYKPPDLRFEMNNGTQRLKEDVQYDYLYQFKSKPLSAIIDMLVKKYLPANLASYRKGNLRMCAKHKACAGVPPYLRECSEWVLDEVLAAHFEATEEADQHLVQYVAENEFMVSVAGGSGGAAVHRLNFHPSLNRVSCTCAPFKKCRLICKHVVVVGIKFPEWHLSKITCWLFDDPIFKLDREFQRDSFGLEDSGIAALEEDLAGLDGGALDVRLNDLGRGALNANLGPSLSAHGHLQSKCKAELRTLESLSILLSEERLHTLLAKLSAIREENSQYLNSINEYLDMYLERNSFNAKDELSPDFLDGGSTELAEEMIIEIGKIS